MPNIDQSPRSRISGSYFILLSFAVPLLSGLIYSAPIAFASIQKHQSQATPTSSAEIETLKTSANTSFWARDYKTAKTQVSRLLEGTQLDDVAKARCLVNRAICESQLEDWEGAKKDDTEALKLARAQSLTFADATALKARILLMDNKISEARELYLQAIANASALQTAWGPDLAPFYEGLAGCYLIEKNYAKAEESYRKVAQLDLLKYGSDDTHLAWALMSLASVDRQIGKAELSKLFYKKVLWNFRHQNELRILEEHKNDPDQSLLQATLQQNLYGTSGAYNNREMGLELLRYSMPSSITMHPPEPRQKLFDNWFKERVGRERAPGLAFVNPNKPLKGLILAVHGLGLNSHSYTAFGERIQKEGYGLISFDVRGFGSYRNDEITQKLDLHEAIIDIQRILIDLRADYPGAPIVLLGESMGGAIVLRIASESPELIDAVVSSVPSGSRYQAKKTAFKVALKFLNNRHEQFNVGDKIFKQITADSELRDMWEGDAEMRMKLSPAELLNFQRFMNGNVKAAAKIAKTPVLIYQGFSDNLVKPMGTLAIYQAIATKDKDMIFVGRAEHLIFEEGRFDDSIFRTTLEWMQRHTQK